MENRYYVDERSGCVAVMDRRLINKHYNGLHSDTEGVVKYWHGTQQHKTCPTCGHIYSCGWMVDDDSLKAAHEVCDEMNRRESFRGGEELK